MRPPYSEVLEQQILLSLYAAFGGDTITMILADRVYVPQCMDEVFRLAPGTPNITIDREGFTVAFDSGGRFRVKSEAGSAGLECTSIVVDRSRHERTA